MSGSVPHITISHTGYSATITSVSRGTTLSEIEQVLAGHHITHGVLWDVIDSLLFDMELGTVFQEKVIAHADISSVTMSIFETDHTYNKSELETLFNELSQQSKTVEQLPKESYAIYPIPLYEHSSFIQQGSLVLTIAKDIHFTDIYGTNTTTTDIFPWFSFDSNVIVKEKSAHWEVYAHQSGYLGITGAQLTILSPVYINAHKTAMLFLSLPVHNISTLLEALIQFYNEKNENHSLPASDVDSVKLLLDQHTPVITPILMGKEPVDSIDSVLTMHIQETYLPSEQNSAINYNDLTPYQTIKKDTSIAQLSAGIQGVPGRDIYGTVILPKRIPPSDFSFKANISEKVTGGGTEYFAEKDGILKLSATSASVYEALVITGDVSQQSGNIKHDSDVIVTGSICRGFKVETTGALIVEGNIESDTTIGCTDLCVKGGIIGTLSSYAIKGTVHTGFIQNSALRIPGQLKVMKYIYNSTIFSRKSIVIRGYGSANKHRGCVVGGSLSSFESITVHSAGSEMEKTHLSAGIDPQLVTKLEQLKQAFQSAIIQISDLQNQVTITMTHESKTHPSQMSATAKQQCKQKLMALKQLLVHKQLIEEKIRVVTEKTFNNNSKTVIITIENQIIPDTRVSIGKKSTLILKPTARKYYCVERGVLVQFVA